MKMMGLMSKGFVTAQKVRGGGKSLSAWRGKRFGLRWVRTVLMGRQGRLFAMTIFLTFYSFYSVLAQFEVYAQFIGNQQNVYPCDPPSSQPVNVAGMPFNRWFELPPVEAGMHRPSGRIERKISGRLLIYFIWRSESPPPDDLKRFTFVARSTFFAAGMGLECGACSGGSTNYDSFMLCGDIYNDNRWSDHIEILNLSYEPVRFDGSIRYWLAIYELKDLEWLAWAEGGGSCEEPCLFDTMGARAQLHIMVSNRTVLLRYGPTYKKGYIGSGFAVPVLNDEYTEADTIVFYYPTTRTWERVLVFCANFVGDWINPICSWNRSPFNCSLYSRNNCCATYNSIFVFNSSFPKTCSVVVYARDVDGYWDDASFETRLHLPLEKDRLLASEPFSRYDGTLAADPPLRNGERPATGSICASLDFAFTWSTTITDTVSGNIGAEIGDRDAAIEANFGAEFSASISVSELIQRGIQVCIEDIPLNPYEWLVPVYVPFGNKELWLCDVYTIYGFAGQVLACNYTRPQAPPYCYLTYFIAPPWVNDISEYMARMARRGICSPRGGGIRQVPIR